MHSDNGQRRVWAGVLAGVAAALVLLLVAGTAYRAGEDEGNDDADRVVETIDDGEPGSDGDRVVRVVDDDDRDWEGGPGFLLFPLFVILLVFLALRAGRGWGHGWGHRGGYRTYGPGPPWLDDWHRQAHEEPAATTPSAPPTSATPGEPQEPTTPS